MKRRGAGGRAPIFTVIGGSFGQTMRLFKGLE